MKQFDHERLDVYKRSIEFVVFANGVVEGLPRGRGHLADQLHRAATSIPLNIAEGAGEFAPREKARFYRMARRSATESAAVLDVCLHLSLITQDRHGEGRDLLLQVVSMLVRMISNLGPGAPGDREEKAEGEEEEGEEGRTEGGQGQGQGEYGARAVGQGGRA